MFPIPGIGYILAGVALIAALGIVAYKLDNNGYKRGLSECQAAFAKRDNEALSKALSDLSTATKKVRDLEIRSQEDQGKVAKTLQSEIKKVTNEKDKTIAALNDGSLRLRVELASRPSEGSGSSSGSVSSSGQLNNGPTTAELSGKTSEFLVSEASRADSIVKQLTAAQAALLADREVCK